MDATVATVVAVIGCSNVRSLPRLCWKFELVTLLPRYIIRRPF